MYGMVPWVSSEAAIDQNEPAERGCSVQPASICTGFWHSLLLFIADCSAFSVGAHPVLSH